MSKKENDYWKENGAEIRTIRPIIENKSPPPMSDSAKRALEIQGISDKFMAMNKDEITQCLLDPKTTMLEMTIGSAIVKAAKDGDFSKLNAFIEKMVRR